MTTLALLLTVSCAGDDSAQSSDSGGQSTEEASSKTEASTASSGDSENGSFDAGSSSQGEVTSGSADSTSSGSVGEAETKSMESDSVGESETMSTESDSADEAESEMSELGDEGQSGTTESTESAGDSATDSSDTESDDSETGSESSDDEGPMIVDLDSTSDSITEAESVTIIALVTDPDGPGDILGGKLLAAQGEDTLAAFSSDNGSTYTVTITWEDLHEHVPIEFDGDAKRDFLVEFVDASGHKGRKQITITLQCEHSAACDGKCVNLAADDWNCGACGHSCRPTPSDTCKDRKCSPSLGECIGETSGVDTCAEYCESIGESCAQNMCGKDMGTVASYGDNLSCSYWETEPYPSSCSERLDFDTPYFDIYRCCCTDTQ